MAAVMRVAKWGNSLAVRLPADLVDALGLKPGDELDVISATRQHLEVKRNTRRDEALARIRRRRWSAPEPYRFDRDEANER
ncbi:MAG TPA: AbrB/MazE/SpoVT family DNA-binding domain-containing protein [Stellaceae bacterium]|nr:AbrB/MazE/SpoVT family DNA-binding domain-containing protein [Stellaceae bacterium]